jgi:hypothetical protein
MTTFKNNSVRLFEQAKNNNALRGIALDVFGIVCQTPGLTGGEIFRAYESKHPASAVGRSRNEIAKRVSDLANWGAVKVDGTTICPESGRKASRWVPTGKMPVAKEDRYSHSDKKPSSQPTPVFATNSSTVDLPGAIRALAGVLGVNVSSGLAGDILKKHAALSKVIYSGASDQNSASDRNDESQQKLLDFANSQLAVKNDRIQSLETELKTLKAGAASINGESEQFLLDFAKQNRMTTSASITYALSILKEYDEGTLVHKADVVSAEAMGTLKALASRSRLILRFKKFLPKRYVAQAEAVVAACTEAANACEA